MPTIRVTESNVGFRLRPRSIHIRRVARSRAHPACVPRVRERASDLLSPYIQYIYPAGKPLRRRAICIGKPDQKKTKKKTSHTHTRKRKYEEHIRYNKKTSSIRWPFYTEREKIALVQARTQMGKTREVTTERKYDDASACHMVLGRSLRTTSTETNKCVQIGERKNFFTTTSDRTSR